MEMNEERPQVIALDLLSAFHQPGCALCHIEQQAADRHLFGLLWENMGDMSFRLRLADSLGFCPAHTWQFYRLAAVEFEDEISASVLYQDIVRSVLNHLHTLESCLPAAAPRLRRQKAQARHHVQAQTPVRPCPACAEIAAAQERNLHWLIAGCADATFRTRYAASDGLCLSHLRQAVETAVQIDPNAARFLVRLSILKGESLAADLNEYIRKRAWENRLEVIHEAEQNAACRAARFLGGLEQDVESESRRRRQAKHISIQELKQKGLRIDE